MKKKEELPDPYTENLPVRYKMPLPFLDPPIRIDDLFQVQAHYESEEDDDLIYWYETKPPSRR